MERIAEEIMQKRKTEEQKRADALYAFVRSECAKRTDIKNITGLSLAMDVPYHVIYRGLKTGQIKALLMNKVIHALQMDEEAVKRLYKI